MNPFFCKTFQGGDHDGRGPFIHERRGFPFNTFLNPCDFALCIPECNIRFSSIQERCISCLEVHIIRFPRRKHVSNCHASFHEQVNFCVANGPLAATPAKGSTLLQKQCTSYATVQQQVTFNTASILTLCCTHGAGNICGRNSTEIEM